MARLKAADRSSLCRRKRSIVVNQSRKIILLRSIMVYFWSIMAYLWGIMAYLWSIMAYLWGIMAYLWSIMAYLWSIIGINCEHQSIA